MNILLLILGSLLIGLIIGNVKWKIVFGEYANAGRWYKNLLFWFFFPWRCMEITPYDPESDRGFRSTRPYREEGSIFSDMDRKPCLNRSVTMDTLFWIPLVIYNVASLILIVIGYILFHLFKRILFPLFKLTSIPIRKFFCWVTFDLFGNKQVS